MTSAKMGPAKLANVGGGSTTLGPETKTPPPSPPTTTMATTTTTTTTNTTVLASSSRPTREDPERLNEDDEGDNDDDDDAGKANLCGHKQEEEEQQHSCASGMERNIAQLATNDAADAADADASESNECHGAPVRRAAATANPSAQANQIKSSESEANTSTTTISDEINNNDDDKDAEQCADNRLSPGTRCATRPQTLGRRHYHHQDEPLAGERLTSELDGEELVLRNSPAGSSGALESQRSTGASREHSSSLCQEGATDSGSSEGDGGEGDPITDWPTSGSKKSDIVVRTSPKAEVLSCKFDRCTTIPVSERREETTTSQEEEEEEDGEQQHQQQDPNEGPSESETVMGKRLGRPASAAAQVPLPSTPTQTGTGTIEFKFQQQQQQQQHSSSNRGPQASTTGAAGPRPKRARTPLGTSRENSIIGNASSPGRQQHPSSATPNSNGHNNNNSDKTVITPTGRPASAMAGGLATTLATVATNSATTRPDAASCAPKSLTPSHTSSQQRPKTTRVRINSTSEQIQDPNWLIEMSREFELQQKQQHSKRMFAFRSLQQRLKSTIVGGGSSSGGSPSKLADVPHDNQQPPPVNATDGRQLGSSSAGHQQAMGTNNANMVPPPIPSTPVKIPVSILKQPTNSHQQSQRPSHTANAKSIAQPSTSMACNKPPNASASSGSTSAPLQDVSNSTGASGGRPASRNVASPTNNHHTSSHSSSSLPKNTKRGGGELGETGGVAAKQAPQSGKQSATIKTSQVTKSALAIASQGDLDQCQSHKQQPQQQQQSTQSSSASQRQVKQTSQTAPSPQAPSSAQIQPAANQHHSPTGATSTGQQQSQQQPQPQQQYRTTTVRPICADGQVKVSGWKRNNLLAKTLSHFDEIRGNQRPIFMPTKITLPSTESPESCGAPQASLGAAASQLVVGSPSSGAHGGADGSLGMRNPSLLSSPSAARANKFADIVREALLKKSLLVSGTGNHQPAAASNSVVVISHRVSDTPDAASSSQHQQQYQRAKCDSASSEMGPPSANHSAKRSVSAEPGRPSVSSLGRDSIAGSSSTTGGAGNQSRRSRQLLLDSGESSSSQQQQQQLQNQQTHSGGQYGGARSTSSAGSTTSAVSMAQIIAAAVAASSGDHHQQPARTSFSLSSSSSSRAFKLQLKNEQVLQNLRRQSNEHHRDSLVAHLAGGGVGVTSSSVTSSAAAATHLDPELGPSSVAGGNGPQSGSMLGSSNRSSVRLRDWKRLTTKLGLLTGRAGERQAFAGAVRSAAGTPPHPYGQPLRLTVSNQEANSRNTRRVRRGSNEQQNSGGSLVPSHCSGGRLLVPGGSSSGGGGAGGGGGLFDAPNRRHSSQTCVSAEPTGGERKLSSSSMVVQSFTDSNASKLDSAATAAGAGHRQRLTGLGVPVVGGGRGRMSRSAAASPMLQAHQDSMCLRRSSDSEACERIRGKGKLVLSGSRCGASPAEEDVDPLLSSSLAGAPADLGTGRRRQCSSTGSSVSSETGTTRQLRATASDSSAVTSQNNPKTTPVVVKRDDLIHLQQVANLSGVSLAVSQASGGDECSCCDPQHVAATSSKSDSSACSCGCHHQHTPTKKPINAGETLDTTANSQQAVEIALPNLVDKIDDSAGGGGGGSVTQLGGGIAEPSGDEQRPDPTAAIETETTPTKQKGPRKNDLSWVVKRTSKVAYFQQKLRKIRWHSKQQQQPDEAANQGDERQQQQRLHAGQFEGDPAEAPIDRDDNLMTNEDQQLARPAKKGTPRRRKSKNGTQDCKELEAKDELVGDDERSAVSGKQVASDIFMDPTLIGDAIEIFLRTTMQQQQQQQQEEEQQRKHKLLGNDETKSAFGPLQEGGAHEVRGPDDGDKRAPTLRTLRAQVLSEPADEQEGS